MSVMFRNLWQTEWLYFEEVEFDGIGKRIFIHPRISALTVRNNIYSAWKRWVQLHKNAGYPQAMRVIGGDPTGAGVFAGDIYFLMNGWQIVVDHPITLDGILYHDDAGTSPYSVQPGGGVVATVSSLTQTIEVGGGGGSGGATASQIWGTSTSTLTTPGSVGEAIRLIGTDVGLTKNNLATARSEISAVNSNVSSVSTKIDDLETSLTTNNNEFTVVVNEVGTKVDGLVTTVDGVVTSIDGVVTSVDAVTASVDTISTTVGVLQTLAEQTDTKVDDIISKTEVIQTDVTSVLGNLADATLLINTLLKYESNRTKVDQAAKTLTVFDDDGVTPIKVFSLKNFLGQPSITEVAERSPT